jgi:hypothetical protein
MNSRNKKFALFFISIFSLFLTFVFTSCSVEKRRYMDGYHVQWKKEQSGLQK